MNIDSLKKVETYKVTTGIILVGVGAGFSSFGLQYFIHNLSRWSIVASTDENLYSGILVSFLFVILSYYLMKLYFPETGGSGIPHVKLSLVALKGKMSKRLPFGKFITSVFSLSSGLCMGREGPLVTISASLAHFLAKILKLSRESTKLLVIAGASSGLSGAFNTPIAAVVFTIEEVLGEINSKYMGAIIISSVIASTVAFNILGAEPIFNRLSYTHESEWHLIFYSILGIGMSVLAEVWKAGVLYLKDIKSNKYFSKKEILFVLLIFSVIIVSSLFDRRSLGDGHSLITQVFEGVDLGGWKVLLGLFIVKIILSALSYSTGLSGGLFMPILCMGALGGALFATGISALGVQDIQIGAFALLGMTSLLVATVRVPFTAFVMLFELTRDYEMILPLMVSSVTSYIFSQLMNDESIYESISEYEGVHLPTQKDKETLGEMAVSSCMSRDVKSIDAWELISEIKPLVSESEISGFPVIEHGRLVGIISRRDILDAEDNDNIFKVCRKDVICIHPDQSLLIAIEKLQRFKIGRLPVTSRFNKKQIVGIITLEDIFKYFGNSKHHEA